MSELYIEHFRRHGFRRPIGITTSRSYLIHKLVPIVVTACMSLYGVLHQEQIAQAGGAFLMVIVCLYVVFLAPRFFHASKHGLLVFSENGVYNGLYGLTFAWDDLGPAWIFSTRVRGREIKVIHVLLRHASVYRRQLPWYLRWQIGSALYVGRQLLIGLEDKPGSQDMLERLRDERHAEGDTAQISTLPLQESGISPEQVVEIINRTVLGRMG